MRFLKFVILVWAMQSFYTFDGVLEFINSLPPERALEAKIVCTDQNMPCKVFYRTEAHRNE